ncbi:hypothetical protein FOXYSP1_17909 [Fusarium oxysporum f. sp. phaseoli]
MGFTTRLGRFGVEKGAPCSTTISAPIGSAMTSENDVKGAQVVRHCALRVRVTPSPGTKMRWFRQTTPSFVIQPTVLFLAFSSGLWLGRGPISPENYAKKLPSFRCPDDLSSRAYWGFDSYGHG